MSAQWMPLYVGDYLRDTRRLSTLEHGAYMLLIMDYWTNSGLPDDDRRLARIAGLSIDEWSQIRPAIAELFQDGWKHKRIDKELARATGKSEAARSAAGLRWQKEREAGAMRPHSVGNTNAILPEPEPQPQEIRPLESSNELSSGSSAALPLDPPLLPGVLDLKKARERKTESDLDLLDKITDLWNAWARRFGSPQVERLTPKRGMHCRRRLEDLKAYGHDAPEAAFSFLLEKCSLSFYARGSPRKPLDFDQLMREDFMTKMLEGVYEYREARRG